MKKKNFLLIFVLPLLLTGCSTTPENLIPSDFVEDLTGTYVGKEGTLEVSDESVKLNDKTLTPTKYVVENFTENEKTVEHAVTYLKDGKEEYRIYFSGDNGKYKLALEKKTTLGGKTGYSLVSKFMPTIEEFTGSYTYDGSGNEYNAVFTLGNNYNKYHDAFDVYNYSLFAGSLLDAYYATSAKVIFNNEVRTIVNYYDFVDNYLYYSFLLEEVDGQYGLVDYDYAAQNGVSYLDFAYDPLFLSLNYYSEEQSIQGTLDAENKSVTYGDKTYSYEISQEEGKGQIVTLKNDSSEIKVAPSPYGLSWEENNQAKVYAHNDLTYLYGEYTYEDKTFEFINDSGEDQVFINGEETEFDYAMYNNRKSVKVKIDDKDTYFLPFKQEVAILASTSDGENLFINKAKFSTSYGKRFVSKGEMSFDTIEITPDFVVNYRGKLVPSYLYYDPSLLYPYLQFEIGKDIYRFEFIEEDIGAATLTCNDEVVYFFEESVINEVYDSYTSQGSTDIVVNKYTLTFEGKTVDYSIEPYYYDMTFSYLTALKFSSEGKEYTAFTAPQMLAMDITNGDNTVTTKTYITLDSFNELVGEYYLDALYGPEKIKLTADGHLYADSMNATNDGLVYDVEYPYELRTVKNVMTGKVSPSIIFYPRGINTIGIQLVKDGNTLNLNGAVYTVKHLFDFRGVYVADNGSGVIEIREDSLYVDGEEATISDVSYDEYGTYITATSNYSEYTYTFMNYDGEFYVSSDKNGYTSYTKSTFDFNSLVGTYVSGLTTYTLSRGALPTNPDVPYGFILSDGFLQYTTYSFVIKNGTVAMKFDTGMKKIYIFSGESGNQIEVEGGSIPEPPGPPSPPPTL